MVRGPQFEKRCYRIKELCIKLVFWKVYTMMHGQKNIKIWIFVYLFSNFYLCDICQNTVVQSATLQVEHIKLVSFLCLCAEQTLNLPDATPFLFSLGRTWNILHFLNPPCRLSAASFTSCCWQVGHVRAVDVKASDSSPALSFPSFLSSGSVISWTQSSMKSLIA